MRPALLALLAVLCGGGLAQAQQAQGFLVSLSADDALPGEVVREQDVVFHAAGQGTFVAWPGETFSLFTVESAQGVHAVFTDIDALHELPVGALASHRLQFSISSDEAGFKDGDIIGVGPSGLFEVLVSEAEFMAAAGVTDGNVDVDAYQLDPDGGVLFSFGDNEASSFLSGSTPGVIQDGDVLYWPVGAAVAQVLYTEAQINAFVTKALGASTTTTDTTSLARHPDTGDLLFSVQSPTSHDATVFSVADGGSILPGCAEADFGFTVGPELDALSVAWSRHVALTTSAAKPAAGTTVELRIRNATRSFPHLVFASLALGAPQFPLAGWGGFVLTPDALLSATLASAPSLLIVPDALGTGSYAALLPAVLGPADVVVQVVSPGPDLAGSNPVLLEVAQ